jgi:hypothetical protein
MMLVTHHKYQYFIIYTRSKLKIFDSSGSEVYVFLRIDGVGYVKVVNLLGE